MAEFYSVAPVFPVADIGEAEIIQPLRKQPYGNWEFEVRDLNGYLLVFSEEA
jgi:uncharacterized glyoxalase superfamily protein PhnB